MKKVTIATVLFLALFSLNAQESASPAFSVDLSPGIYMDQFPAGSDGGSNLVGFFQTLFSLRGGGDLSARVSVTDLVSVGASVGIYAMSVDLGSGTSNFVDLPARALVRLGLPGFAVEAHAGYLVTLFAGPSGTVADNGLGGLEYGLKACLAGFYLDYTLMSGKIPYTRIGVGLQMDNFFKL